MVSTLLHDVQIISQAGDNPIVTLPGSYDDVGDHRLFRPFVELPGEIMAEIAKAVGAKWSQQSAK